jgi:hypothetical protein
MKSNQFVKYFSFQIETGNLSFIFSLIEMMNFIGEFKPIEFLPNMTHFGRMIVPFSVISRKIE